MSIPQNSTQKQPIFGKNTLAGALILMLIAGYIEGRIAQGNSNSRQESYQSVVENSLLNINASLIHQTDMINRIEKDAIKRENAMTVRIDKLEHVVLTWEDEIEYVQVYRKTGSWIQAEDILKSRNKK